MDECELELFYQTELIPDPLDFDTGSESSSNGDSDDEARRAIPSYIQELLSTPRRQHLNRDQRFMIHTLYFVGGHSQVDIARRLGIGNSSVSRCINSERPTPKKRKRPIKLSKEQVDSLEAYIRTSHLTRRQSMRALAAGPFAGFQVTGPTLARALRARGYRRRPARRQMILSNANIAKRLAFAEKWQHLTADDWVKKFVFSDETWVRGHSHRKVWVCILLTPIYIPPPYLPPHLPTYLPPYLPKYIY